MKISQHPKGYLPLTSAWPPPAAGAPAPGAGAEPTELPTLVIKSFTLIPSSDFANKPEKKTKLKYSAQGSNLNFEYLYRSFPLCQTC